MSGALVTPDFTRGFVKLPRSVLRELLTQPLLLAVYLAVLDRAAYHAGPRLLRGHGVQHLDIGEAVIGRAELAKLCGSTSQSVRTSLAHLKKLGFLTSKSTNLGTRITIVGYGEIGEPAEKINQQINQEINQRPTNDQPTDQPLTDKRKRRNVKTGDTRNERPPGVHCLRDVWSNLYKQRHGVEYVFTKRDYGTLKELDGNPGVDETTRRMHVAFEAPPKFPPQPWSLGTFVQNINQCAKPTEARTAGGDDVRTGRVEPQTDPSAYGEGDQKI